MEKKIIKVNILAFVNSGLSLLLILIATNDNKNTSTLLYILLSQVGAAFITGLLGVKGIHELIKRLERKTLQLPLFILTAATIFDLNHITAVYFVVNGLYISYINNYLIFNKKGIFAIALGCFNNILLIILVMSSKENWVIYYSIIFLIVYCIFIGKINNNKEKKENYSKKIQKYIFLLTLYFALTNIIFLVGINNNSNLYDLIISEKLIAAISINLNTYFIYYGYREKIVSLDIRKIISKFILLIVVYLLCIIILRYVMLVFGKNYNIPLGTNLILGLTLGLAYLINSYSAQYYRLIQTSNVINYKVIPNVLYLMPLIIIIGIFLMNSLFNNILNIVIFASLGCVIYWGSVYFICKRIYVRSINLS